MSIDPHSKRQQVFKFLFEHPNTPNKVLYETFDASTENQKTVIRQYKNQFFQKYGHVIKSEQYPLITTAKKLKTPIQSLIDIYKNNPT